MVLRLAIWVLAAICVTRYYIQISGCVYLDLRVKSCVSRHYLGGRFDVTVDSYHLCRLPLYLDCHFEEGTRRCSFGSDLSDLLPSWHKRELGLSPGMWFCTPLCGDLSQPNPRKPCVCCSQKCCWQPFCSWVLASVFLSCAFLSWGADR